MPALATVPEGPAPEWQRWAKNPKMLNRMIKDEARSIKRIIQRSGVMDEEKVHRLLVTTRYLASLQEIDENGVDSLDELIKFCNGHSESLWKKMEYSNSSSNDSDDEDPALIMLNGQCSEVAALIVEARLAQRMARASRAEL